MQAIQFKYTVGSTKDRVGKGKRIIIVDCITEIGQVPGALWIFSTDSKSQLKREKQEISFEESAVTEEKARETEDTLGGQDNESKVVSAFFTTQSKKRKSITKEPTATAKRFKRTQTGKTQ